MSKSRPPEENKTSLFVEVDHIKPGFDFISLKGNERARMLRSKSSMRRFARQVQAHCGLNKPCQRSFINLLALANIDSASRIAVEA